MIFSLLSLFEDITSRGRRSNIKQNNAIIVCGVSRYLGLGLPSKRQIKFEKKKLKVTQKDIVTLFPANQEDNTILAPKKDYNYIECKRLDAANASYCPLLRPCISFYYTRVESEKNSSEARNKSLQNCMQNSPIGSKSTLLSRIIERCQFSLIRANGMNAVVRNNHLQSTFYLCNKSHILQFDSSILKIVENFFYVMFGNLKFVCKIKHKKNLVWFGSGKR